MVERVERYRPNKKVNESSTAMRLVLAPLTLFGRPLLLHGEDAAEFDELLARFRSDITPRGAIEEMLTFDVAQLQWELMRWRRIETTLMREVEHGALEDFLGEELDYELYSDQFADLLTETLEEKLPDDQGDDSAKTLARACARNEPQAVDRVNKILAAARLTLNHIVDDARARRAKGLVNEFLQRKPKAVTLVHELLAGASTSIDTLIAVALMNMEGIIKIQLDHIERINGLVTIAEGRRNAALREIDRRRLALSELLRRTIEDVEFQEKIETRAIEGQKRA